MKDVFKYFAVSSIPKSIWMLGVVSFLINVSSIIVFTISPSYLIKVLGVTTLGMGFLQGTVDCTAWFTRIFSGILSDYWGKRKLILMFASGLIFLSRPLFIFSPDFIWFYGAKTLDRFGNGIQATPREALIGDMAPQHLRGACYGLRQSLSVAGSLVGAIVIIFFPQTSEVYYTTLFWIAAIPPLMALIILFLAVKDVPFENTRLKEKSMFSFKNVKSFSSDYWSVVGVSCLFALSNYSGAFMLLHAESIAGNKIIAPLAMMIQNGAAMISAYPIGHLSDRIGHRLLLATGFLMVVISGFFFAFATNTLEIIIGAMLWGFQIGITQSLLMTKVAETTVVSIRGTAFGIYYALMGIMLFLSNVAMGSISHYVNFSAAFLASSAMAAFALCCLPLLKSSEKTKKNKMVEAIA